MTIRSRLAKLERFTNSMGPAEMLLPLKPGERQAILRSVAARLRITVPELLANYEAQTGADASEMLREYEDEEAKAADPMQTERSSAGGEAQ